LHNFGKGTRVTYGALDYLKKLKIVESDDVYSKAFYLEFSKLRSLEIEQKDLASDDWNHIINWLSRIPSPDFSKLSIKTKSLARPELVHQVANVVSKMHQAVSVDISCEELALKLCLKQGWFEPVPIDNFSIKCEQANKRNVIRLAH
jgi:hypothetical protein